MGALDKMGLAKKKQPPSLGPQNIIRSILFVQSTFRRNLLAKKLSRTQLERLPGPAALVAAEFCQSLLQKKTRSPEDVEAEAMGVAALICGRDSKRPDLWKKVRGLDLACIAGAHDYYAPDLPKGPDGGDHPVLLMLQERFREVAMDVEDDIMERLQTANLPSEARRRMKAALTEWGCPATHPGAKAEDEEAFPHAQQFIADLKGTAEQVIGSQLETATTWANFAALKAAVEREMGGQHTLERERVRRAMERHQEHTQMAAMNHYGWPPTGPLPRLEHSARWYAKELGMACPITEDFAATVVRSRKRLEQKAQAELLPCVTEINQLRKKLEADPPPPKLMAQGWREQLEEKFKEAVSTLKHWDHDLGRESDVYMRLRQGIYGVEFPSLCLKDMGDLVKELRRVGPWQDPGRILDEPVETSETSEARLLAAAGLWKLLPWLRQTGSKDQADALAAEFRETLADLEPYMKLTDPDEFEDEDGWHKPPGMEKVEIPYKPPTPPPPKPKSPPKPPPVSGPEKKFAARIKLHGVTLEDMRCRSEILLLEQCAGIIAKECGIPQEWIGELNMVVAPESLPASPALDAEL